MTSARVLLAVALMAVAIPTLALSCALEVIGYEVSRWMLRLLDRYVPDDWGQM